MNLSEWRFPEAKKVSCFRRSSRIPPVYKNKTEAPGDSFFRTTLLNASNFLSFKSLKCDLLLPCQWHYWHRAKNRVWDKTGFGIYNLQNVQKIGFGQPVCLSVLLSFFPRTLTGVRVDRSSWNFRGMFGLYGALPRNNFWGDSSTHF